MLKFIIIIVILTMYIILASLMRAAGKDTPVIPEIKHDEDN